MNIFLHIPKTAGTSVRQVLAQVTGLGTGLGTGKPRYRFSDDWDLGKELVKHPCSSIRKWDTVGGHLEIWWFYPLIRQVAREGRTCHIYTVLRNPVERAFSDYNHFRRTRNHPMHDKALSFPFDRFYREVEKIHNPMCRYLCGEEDHDKALRNIEKFKIRVGCQRNLEPFWDRIESDFYAKIHDRSIKANTGTYPLPITNKDSESVKVMDREDSLLYDMLFSEGNDFVCHG